MIVPSANGLTIARSATPHGLALASHVASEAFLRSAEVLKAEDERSSVLVGEVPEPLARALGLPPEAGRRVVVKTLRQSQPIKRLLQGWMGTTRHLRQWRGAELLQAHGFAAARPLVVFRSRHARGPSVESLVLEWRPGKMLLQHMADRDLSLKQEHALADAVGELIARAASRGMVIGDGKPSNFIVDWRASQPTLSLIDTMDARAHLSPGGEALSAALADLVIEPTGVDCLPRRAVRWRVLRRACEAIEPGGSTRGDAKRWWRAVAQRLSLHGDPTPRVNPLSMPKQTIAPASLALPLEQGRRAPRAE